jgi:hypothetical protein
MVSAQTGDGAQELPVTGEAETNLAAPCEPPADFLPQTPLNASELPSRSAQPASDARPRSRISACGDLETLNRVLAGLKGLEY